MLTAFHASKLTVSSVLVDSATLAYPILFSASKDGKTHYILGTYHPTPGTWLPDYIQAIIENSDCILTESDCPLSSKEQEKYFDYFFSPLGSPHFLNDLSPEIAQQFSTHMRFLLKQNGLDDTKALSEYCPFFLCLLFENYCRCRLCLTIPSIDQQIANYFFQEKKPFIFLREADREVYFEKICPAIRRLSPEEKAEQMKNAASRITELFTYYEKYGYLATKEDTLEALQYLNQQDPLEENSLNARFTAELRWPEARRRDIIPQENIAWREIFLENAKRFRQVLMVCGSKHVIAPKALENYPEFSILGLLEQEGFAITRIPDYRLLPPRP